MRLLDNLQLDLPAITVCKPEHAAYNDTVLAAYGLRNGLEVSLEVTLQGHPALPYIIREQLIFSSQISSQKKDRGVVWSEMVWSGLVCDQ